MHWNLLVVEDPDALGSVQLLWTAEEEVAGGAYAEVRDWVQRKVRDRTANLVRTMIRHEWSSSEECANAEVA